MRPIKFRAWTGTEMRYDIVGIDWDESFEVHNAWLGNNIEYNADNFLMNVILMQSTDLKDKNGVEIYEGDIVKHTDNFSNITTINKVYWKGGSLVFDVVVDEGLVYDVPLYKITEDNAEGYDDELEVLGNIYENPELLEESE